MTPIDCKELWPKNSDPTTITLHWSYFAGALQSLSPEILEPTLIGIRGVELGAAASHEVVARPSYDDTFVLIVKGKHPVLFPGATHPYQLHSKLAEDGDGDGRPDVACIRPGRYVMRRALVEPQPIFTIETIDGRAHIPAARDLTHDGRISADEARLELTASAILFHTGFDAPPNALHRSSIGCQTASLPWLKLLALAGPVIKYHLVTAEQAMEHAAATQAYVREATGSGAGNVA